LDGVGAGDGLGAAAELRVVRLEGGMPLTGELVGEVLGELSNRATSWTAMSRSSNAVYAANELCRRLVKDAIVIGQSGAESANMGG